MESPEHKLPSSQAYKTAPQYPLGPAELISTNVAAGGTSTSLPRIGLGSDPRLPLVQIGETPYTSLMHVQKHLAVPAPAVEPILANPTVAESPFPSDLEVRETILTTLSWTTLWWGLDGEQTPESSRNMR